MRLLAILILLACSLPAQVTHYQIRFVSADPSGSCSPSYITINRTTGAMYGCVGGTWTAIGGSGSPTGSAGGDLAGTYPNPTLANKNQVLGPVIYEADGSIVLSGSAVIDMDSGHLGNGNLTLLEQVPTTPNSSTQTLYYDPTTHHLTRINSSAVVTDLEAPCSTCEVTTRKNQANGYLGLDSFSGANLTNPGTFYVAPPGGAPTEGSTLGSDGLHTPRITVGTSAVAGTIDAYEGVPAFVPSASTQALFLDPTTHHLQRKNNSSTIVDLETPTAANVILGFSGTCNSSSAMMGDGTCATISSAFSAVTAGTNATALHIGTGGTLDATGSGTITATTATGNAGTATALASTPSLCSTGSAPTGVLASGNATGCAVLPTGTVTSVSGTAPITVATGTSTPVIGITSHWVSSTSIGIGPSTFTPAGTLDIYDATASTGRAIVTMRDGASANPSIFQVGSSSGSYDLGFQRTRISGVTYLGINNGTVVENSGSYSNLALSNLKLFTGNTNRIIISDSIGIGGVSFASNQGLAWGNTSTDATAGKDISFDRDAAGIVGITNGTVTTTAANYRDIALRALISKGTVPGISGCSAGTQTGGGTVGTYSSGTTGTCTVTLTFATTAPTGWSCNANDRTTVADLQAQTSSTTTTAVIAGTTISGDVINYTCVAY